MSQQAARKLQELGRRRLVWDWVSDAASAVGSAADAVGSAVSSAASAVASGFSWEWGDTQFYERSLLKWNYDSYTRTPTPKTVDLLGSDV